MSNNSTVRTSKALSTILRHTAKDEGLSMRKDGYVLLKDILALKKFKGVTVEDIKSIVSSSDKQRFNLITEKDKLYICANQGHTMDVEVEMEILTVDTAPSVVIHGTYYKVLDTIKKEGLCKMSRQHIHFAVGLPGEDGVISGMRSSCQVVIYLDIKAAMKDGIFFQQSKNNVILSPGIGDRGIIPSKYFSKIVDYKTGKSL